MNGIMSETDGDFITIKTSLPTVPLPPNVDRTEVFTDRLILRPLKQEDLAALHELRTQNEVMTWTTVGRIDANFEETQAKLNLFLPPADATTFNYAICWRETGGMIGVGGNHCFQGEFGWPELGYMIRKEFWGRGLATEFLAGFLKAYAQLPRSPVELRVKRASLIGLDPGAPEECLVAVVESSNMRSHSVLRKVGLDKFLTYVEPDSRDPTKTIELVGYRFHPGRRM